MSSSIAACVSTSFGVTVACSDSTIHCYAIADGTRLLPPVKLQGPASMLRAHDHYVLVITTQGQINVWNIQAKKSVLKTSVVNLIDQGNANLNEKGMNEFIGNFLFRGISDDYKLFHSRHGDSDSEFVQRQNLHLLAGHGILVTFSLVLENSVPS